MKLFKNISGRRIGIVAFLAAVLLGATVSAAAVAGFNGVTASATSSDPSVTVSEIFDSSSGRFSSANLQTLYTKIGGSGTTTVSALKSKIPTSGDKILNAQTIKTNAGGSDIIVSFGGQKWTVTSATTAKNGDVIATLWLAYTPNTDDYKCQFNTWYDWMSIKETYPSSMYSTSYVRNYLNGTGYASGANSFNSSNKQNAAWGQFIKNYSPFIATPSQIAYQGTESAVQTIGYGYNCPNDAYGTPSAGGWYYDEEIDCYLDMTEKNGYYDWADDYLWLPSFTETGYNNSNGTVLAGKEGLWNLSPNQRQNSSNSYTWLRSGTYDYAHTAYNLYSSGFYYIYNVTNSYCVRPALHLNLSSAALSAAGSLPEASKIAQRPKLGETEKIFTGNSQYFYIGGYDSSKVEYDFTYSDGDYWDTEPWEGVNGNIFYMAGMSAGTMTARFTPKAGVQWADGGNNTVIITVEILPYEVEVLWSSLEFTYDGTAKKPKPGGNVTIPNGYGLSYNYSYTKNGSVVTDPINAGTYGVKVTLNEPSDYFHDVAQSITLKNGDTTFKINPKPIEPEWSVSGYTYNGGAQAPAATAQGVSGALSLAYVYKNADGGTISKPADAGSYTVTVSESSGNYAIYGATQSFTIAPKAVAVEWGGLQSPYTGSAVKPTATAQSGVTGVTLALTVTASGINAGEYTATAALTSANANFTLLNTTTKYYITQAQPTVTPSVTGAENLTAGGTMPSITASSGDTAGKIYWTDTALTQGTKNYGWIFVPDSSNYKTLTGVYSLTVAQATGAVLQGLAIEYSQTGEIFANDTVAKLSGKLTYKVFAVYSDGTRTEVNTGYTITLQLSESKIQIGYNGKQTEFSVYVTPKAVSSVSASYTGGSLTDKQTVNDIDKSKLTVTVKYNDGTSKTLAAAEYTLAGNLAAGTSAVIVKYETFYTTFNVSVTGHTGDKITVTVQWDLSSLEFAYDGKAHAPVAYYVINGTDKVLLDVTVSGANATGGKAINAGDYTAKIDQTYLNHEYTLTGDLSKTFTITRRTVNLAWTGATVEYSGAAYLPTPTATADFLDETAVYTLTQNGVQVASAVNAGSYLITVALSDNYSVTSASFEFTIVKAKVSKLAVSSADERKQFETADAAKNYVTNVYGNSSAVEITVTESGGSYTVTVTPRDADNYEAVSYTFKTGAEQPQKQFAASDKLVLILLCVGVGLVVIMATLALILAIKRKAEGAADDDGFYDVYTDGDF